MRSSHEVRALLFSLAAVVPMDVGALGAIHTNAVWTDTTAAGKVLTGAPVCTSGCRCTSWTNDGVATCDTPAGLYCIQQ